MKKKTSLTVILGSSIFAAIVAITSSGAWFTHTAFVNKSENPFGGTVEDAYYAYGDGTADNPFGITRPRHLYNLAWLQYLGFYNHADDHQYYFELDADIDMSGYSALPPIGTELNPFVGNFNGQGHTITNLHVSNAFGDYSLHPAAISGFDNSTKKQPHILGLFGVVGQYTGANIQTSYSSAINELYDVGISNIAVKTEVHDSLMGLAAGYVSSTMRNIAVQSGTINLDSTSADILAYQTTSYGDFTQNISDHTLVGYTTKKTSIKQAKDTTYNIDIQTDQEFTSNLQGDNLGFGGSIDMNSVFKRLTKLHGDGSNIAQTVNGQPNSNAVYSTTFNHHERGDDDPTYTYGNYRQFTGNTGTGNNADYRGVVRWATDGTDTSKKHYLLGGKYEIHNYYEEYDNFDGYRITDGNGNYLTFDGTDDSVPVNSTDSLCHVWEFETTTNNTSGYIRTLYEGTYYYLINNGGDLKIKNVSENQATDWTIAINAGNLDIQISYNQTTYNVFYYNGNWVLANRNAEIQDVHYAIRDGTNRYVPNTLIGNTSNSALTAVNTEQLYFDRPTEGGQIVLRRAGESTPYYLCIYVGTNNRRLTTRTEPGNSGSTYALCAYSTGASDTYYVRTASAINNYYHYMRYNGGWTVDRRSTNNSNATTYRQVTIVEIQGATVSPYTNLHLSNTLSNSTNYYRERLDDVRSYERPVFTSDDTTYMPIIAYDEGDDAGAPKKNNTGYFVAGVTNNVYSTSQDDIPRSIIVSQYDFKDKTSSNSNNIRIANGFSVSQKKFIDSDVYTIDAAGMGGLTSNGRLARFKKYEDSKAGLTTVLNKTISGTTGKVGGFHFFARDSKFSVNKNYVVNAKNVLINGEKKASYQLPVYSLDFYLKDQGYVNFFAAMYNGDNSGAGSTGDNHMNGFFSMHKVYRANDVITNIREIKAIYKRTNADLTTTYINLYRQKNGGVIQVLDEEGNIVANDMSTFDSEAYATSNSLEFCFDTDWILYRKLDGQAGRVFYFEIPVEPGEYCLGGYDVPEGVKMMDGAYLMYLDIGAGSARIKRTAIAEHFIESSFVVSYPNGVALIPTNTISGETISFNSSDSVCAVVKATYIGEFTVTRDNNNNVTVARAASYTSVAKPSYISDTIRSVVDPGADSDDPDDDINLINDFLCDTKETKETYRIQYYDYNVNLKTLSKTIIEDTKTGTLTNEVSSSVSSNATVTLGNFNRKITQIEQNGDVYELNSQNDIDSSNVLIYKYFGEESNDNPASANNGRVWTSYTEVMSESAELYYYIAEDAESGSMYSVSGICSTLDDDILVLTYKHSNGVTIVMTYDLVMSFDSDTMFYPDLDYYVVIPLVRYVSTSTGETVKFVVVDIDSDTTIYFFDGNVILVDGKYVYEITDSVDPLAKNDVINISPIVNPNP